MNESIKALLDEAFDDEAMIVALVKKDYSGALGDLIKGGSDLPALISQASGLLPELKDLLSDVAADQDLQAYFSAKLAGLPANVVGVATAALDLLITLGSVEPKVEALIAALKAPAPAA